MIGDRSRRRPPPAAVDARSSRAGSRRLPWRELIGAGLLLGSVLIVGTGPLGDGLRGVELPVIMLAMAVVAFTTWCCARRWSLVAGELGVGIGTRPAWRACLAAQFLNSTLPSGIAGDVLRAVRHGHESGSPARGMRSVLWERALGQLVLAALAVLAVFVVAPPLRLPVLVAGCGLAVVALAAWSVMPMAWRRTVAGEFRLMVGPTGVGVRLVALSAAAAAGHIVVFVVTARSVGVTAPVAELAALGLVVLQAAAVPLNVAGWGPREGATAAIFGAVGLGADTGLAVAVAYGVVATAATLPGALALIRPRPAPGRTGKEGDRSWASVPTPS